MTSDDLSHLFDAERAVQSPPVEQGLSRFLTDVAQQVAPLPIATGSLKLGLSAVSKWVLGGFVVGLTSAGAASQIWAPEAAARQPITSVAQAARAPEPPVAAATPAPPVPAPPEPAVVARNARPTPGVTAAASESATTFDAELRLITAAKSELDKGRPQFAAAWLAEHAQRFPAGVFALDREALRILVRCGQVKDPSLARAFAEQHPGSPMGERLLRACSQPGSIAAPSAVDFPK